MHLASLGPMTVVPVQGNEDEFLAEEVSHHGGTAPIQTSLEQQGPKDSLHEEARQGFVRLADFLRHQGRKKKKGTDSGKGIPSHVLAAYTRLDKLEESIQSKSLHLNIKT